MKKRFVCFAAAAVMAVSVTACGSGESKSAGAATAAQTTAKETTEAETTVKETTEAETTAKETAAAETAKEETTEAETAGAEEKDSQFQTGTWEDLTFSNPWLNVNIVFPEGSYVYSEEDMKQILGAGQEVLVNNGNYTDMQLKMAEALTVYDFMASLPDGQSNVQLAHENVKLSTGGKGISAWDYLDAVAQQLVTIADMKYELGEKEEVELGGQTFVKLSASVLDGAMYQDYYSIVNDDHVSTLTISYLPDAQDMVDELVAGITAVR